jgi:RNA polymerase sigma-70 factor (ECF subfamily)
MRANLIPETLSFREEWPMTPEFDAELGRNGPPRAPFVAAGRADADASLRREIEAMIPHLRRYARALKRDPIAADDLVQDCLCRALAKAHLWQEGTDLRAWLFTILHHQHCSDVRRSVRRGVDVAVWALPPTPAIGGDAVSRLQLQDLECAIDRLPEVQRQVVLLIGLEGWRYDEVAAVTGVPLGTVRSRLARAREALRGMMDRTEETATASPAGSARRRPPPHPEPEAAI